MGGASRVYEAERTSNAATIKQILLRRPPLKPVLDKACYKVNIFIRRMGVSQRGFGISSKTGICYSLVMVDLLYYEPLIIMDLIACPDFNILQGIMTKARYNRLSV